MKVTLPDGTQLELEDGAVYVGDGAVRYRDLFEQRGAEVPPDGDERHLPRARFHAELARGFGPVELVDPTARRGTSTARLRVRASPLHAVERASRSGLPVTSLDRTVADLLFSRSRVQAVVLVDHLLHSGLATREHLRVLLAARHRSSIPARE